MSERQYVLLGIFLLVLGIFYGNYEWLSTNLSTEGITLAQLTRQKEIFATENQILQEKLYQARALVTIEEKAAKLGFVSSEHSIYFLPK